MQYLTAATQIAFFSNVGLMQLHGFWVTNTLYMWTCTAAADTPAHGETGGRKLLPNTEANMHTVSATMSI